MPALAQGIPTPQIEFDPPVPTAGVPFTARVSAHMTWCRWAPRVVRARPGEIDIRLDLPNCDGDGAPPPPSWRTGVVEIPPVPDQGDYTVRLFMDNENETPDLTAPLTIRPPPAPTLHFSPDPPVAGHPVTAVLTMFMCFCTFAPIVERSGAHVRINLNLPNCAAPIDPRPPTYREVEIPLGILHAGVHELRFFRSGAADQPELVSEITMRDAARPVPLLTIIGTMTLMLLVLFGGARQRRSPARSD